jgi:hypothetical protein
VPRRRSATSSSPLRRRLPASSRPASGTLPLRSGPHIFAPRFGRAGGDEQIAPLLVAIPVVSGNRQGTGSRPSQGGRRGAADRRIAGGRVSAGEPIHHDRRSFGTQHRAGPTIVTRVGFSGPTAPVWSAGATAYFCYFLARPRPAGTCRPRAGPASRHSRRRRTARSRSRCGPQTMASRRRTGSLRSRAVLGWKAPVDAATLGRSLSLKRHARGGGGGFGSRGGGLGEAKASASLASVRWVEPIALLGVLSRSGGPVVEVGAPGRVCVRLSLPHSRCTTSRTRLRLENRRLRRR